MSSLNCCFSDENFELSTIREKETSLIRKELIKRRLKPYGGRNTIERRLIRSLLQSLPNKSQQRYLKTGMDHLIILMKEIRSRVVFYLDADDSETVHRLFIKVEEEQNVLFKKRNRKTLASKSVEENCAQIENIPLLQKDLENKKEKKNSVKTESSKTNSRIGVKAVISKKESDSQNKKVENFFTFRKEQPMFIKNEVLGMEENNYIDLSIKEETSSEEGDIVIISENIKPYDPKIHRFKFEIIDISDSDSE